MIKALLGFAACTVLMAAVSAQASTKAPVDIGDQVMSLLIREANDITLVDEKDQPYDEGYQLPLMITRQLALGYRQPAVGEKSITFGSTKVTCTVGPVTNRPVGAIYYDCDIVFADNTYKVKRGAVGPEESGSALFMKIRFSRDTRPGAPLFLPVKRIVATLAG